MSQLLDIKAAAELLRLHPETVREMARKSDIKATHVGRIWRIKPEDIESYLAQHANGENKMARAER